VTPLRTVALLAREPGLAVLRGALLDDPHLDLIAVATHGRLPRAEGGGPRREAEEYRRLLDPRGVPLLVADPPQSRDLGRLLPERADLLISVSWRSLVLTDVLDRFDVGAINLHRGALPAYGGAEPVRRAIEAGETRMAITAHHMTPEIDQGAEIARVWLDIPPMRAAVLAADYAEDVKAAMVPLYAPLARLAIAAIVAKHGSMERAKLGAA
jgi:methionyl-tRNA formyltransferase